MEAGPLGRGPIGPRLLSNPPFRALLVFAALLALRAVVFALG